MAVFVILSFFLASALADHCPIGPWINIGGTCYRFSTQKLKYQEAVDECGKLSASSLQFYLKEDKDAFLNATSGMKIERWWTTLTDVHTPGTFVWGADETYMRPEEGIVIWNFEPDDTKHLENCGAINVQATISDEDCSERHSYICEYPMVGDGCTDGWKLFNNSCYLIGDTTDPFSNMPWSDAKKYCITAAPGMNSHLLQLENKIEQAFLVQQLPFVPSSSRLWWIGMTDQAKEGIWLWLDGTAVQQQSIQWAIEPNNLGGMEHCAMMYNSGVFSDKSCDELAYYVCVIPPTGDSILKNKLGCPRGWTRAGHKCYSFNYGTQKPWNQASSACQSYGASLLQIESADEKEWIELETRKYREFAFWSGLNYHTGDKTWYWSSGRKAGMNLIRWNSEPNNFAGNEDCAEIFQDGVFNDNSCMSRVKYICEIHLEDAPCPSGWFTMNGNDFNSCYFISNATDLANWDEAKEKCRQIARPYDGALVAFDTQDELTQVTGFLKQVPANPYGWWTGLNDRNAEGDWVYYTSYDNPTGGSKVKINWNSEPSNPETDQCAMIYFGGRYNDVNCKINSSYICETTARRPSFNPSTSNGLIYLPFYLNTLCMVLICWLY